jgi:hypothetical protein
LIAPPSWLECSLRSFENADTWLVRVLQRVVSLLYPPRQVRTAARSDGGVIPTLLCPTSRGADGLRPSAHATARAAALVVISRRRNSASARRAGIGAFVNRPVFH